MPKNFDGAKSRMRSKSTRKPLRDVSNAKIPGKSANTSKKPPQNDGGQTGDDSLDRLLLAQSDLSSIVRQIDELVVQALQLTGNKGKKEIKQFTDLLSDMQTSLKPWVPRLRKALFSQSPEPENKSDQSIQTTVHCVPVKNKTPIIESPAQTKWVSLVSPSPLVSWRAECNTEGGRQLFLLTPLPRKRASSSNHQTLENVKTEENTHPHNKCGAPAKYSDANCSMLVMTPCLKMSPPKSCILLEPISELTKKKNLRVHKSTPFPARVQDSSESEDSELSSSRSSDNLTVKYPELNGININNFETRMAEEDSPDWIVSPPKTCIIMEPVDEKSSRNLSGNCLAPKTAAFCNQQGGLPGMKNIECEDYRGMKCKLDLLESTPMIKEPMSIFRTGKRTGENTLKKELWTRFEAASSHGICFNDPICEDDTAKKGFLDRLDEALDS